MLNGCAAVKIVASETNGFCSVTETGPLVGLGRLTVDLFEQTPMGVRFAPDMHWMTIGAAI